MNGLLHARQVLNRAPERANRFDILAAHSAAGAALVAAGWRSVWSDSSVVFPLSVFILEREPRPPLERFAVLYGLELSAVNGRADMSRILGDCLLHAFECSGRID